MFQNRRNFTNTETGKICSGFVIVRTFAKITATFIACYLLPPFIQKVFE